MLPPMNPARPTGPLVPSRPSPFGRRDRGRGSHSTLARVGILTGVVAAMALAAPAAEAQYFGRNKVQYEQFDWRIFDSPHFSVYFYPAESLATLDMARSAERWYDRLSGIMSYIFSNRPLIFYADHPDFQQTNVISDMPGESTGGVTESGQERVIMPHTGVYAATDQVLGHELVHVFQYGIAAGTDRGFASMNNVPLWMMEGMAEYLSVGQADAHTAMWLRDALRRDDIPTLRQLSTDPRYFPYRFGQAFWAYVGGQYGDEVIPRIYRFALEGGPEYALRSVLGRSSDTLSTEWHDQIRRDYGPMLAGRTAPDSTGTSLVESRPDRGLTHVSPVLSPDGRHFVVYSSRDLFGFSLWLGDAETGRMLRQLTSITSNQHFDAISFMETGATFSPDARKLAFVVTAGGSHELNIMDVDSRRIERRIQVAEVGSISDPAWSPDGKSLVFSGARGGITDLFLFDLETEEIRALTSGRNAELQPTWSPDGRTIAFVTDRGELTNFDLMTFGELRIGLLDVASGGITLLPGGSAGKMINPQFSPDGQSLYVVSDMDGFSDIYRVSLADQQLYRVTQVATGISGITSRSPAISVARESGRILFSVFEQGGFMIQRLEASEAAGVPQEPVLAASDARMLPPVQRQQVSTVDRYIADVRQGMPAVTSFDVENFRRRYVLEYVGVPGVGVSVGGPFGTGAQGGVLGLWGDQLGDTRIGAVAQVNGTLKDIGGQAFYVNRERRIAWGVSAGRTPYAALFGRIVRDEVETGSGPIPVDHYDQIIFRQYFDELSSNVQFPLSTTRRFELAGGFQRISYDMEVHRITTNGLLVIDQRRFSEDPPSAINLGTVTTAYVGDNSFFGYTGPIAGQRFRMEVGGAVGTLNFATALADYRRYFYARPFTLGFRFMHYGRYGSDAEDNRLGQLYLGSPYLIRGYDFNSFHIRECTPQPDGRCPEYERLNGSRLAVANLEFRVPLLGPAPRAIVNFPYLPVDIVPFVDAGVAWTSTDSPDITYDRNSIGRVPVMSSGVAARINLMGYLILETYYVVPFHRPNKSGYVTFQIQPGW